MIIVEIGHNKRYIVILRGFTKYVEALQTDELSCLKKYAFVFETPSLSKPKYKKHKFSSLLKCK